MIDVIHQDHLLSTLSWSLHCAVPVDIQTVDKHKANGKSTNIECDCLKSISYLISSKEITADALTSVISFLGK